jgi:hypothetical protein
MLSARTPEQELPPFCILPSLYILTTVVQLSKGEAQITLVHVDLPHLTDAFGRSFQR